MALILVRTALVYLVVISAMRLMGKKQLGELQPSELVSTILISNLASISIEAPELPIASCEILLSALCVKSRRAARLLSGQPVIVLRDGVVDQDALRSLRFTMDDLLEALRAKDVFDPSQVTCAIVETNGSVSIYRRWQDDTPTRRDLKLSPSGPQKPALPFVVNGEILADNLRWCGKDDLWLRKTLDDHRIGLDDVLLLAGDDSETYHLVKKNHP